MLFQDHSISPQWLVTMRMLGSAVILVVVVRPAWPRGNVLRLVLFGVVGLALVQYTYFAAISLMGVALATFVQYLSLPMIALWEGLVARRGLSRRSVGAIGLAMGGTALLLFAVPGRHDHLRVSAAGLAFAFASALTAAFYTLYSLQLVHRLGAMRTNAWGFVAGGLVMAAITPPWAVHATGSVVVVGALTLFVVVLGTLVPFTIFVASLRLVSATQASTAVTIEPVSAALASAVLLGAALGPLQYAGGALIVGAVLLLRGSGGAAAPAIPEVAA